MRRCLGDTPRVRILLLSNAYPSAAHPAFGAFVARGADALEARGHTVVRCVLRSGERGQVRTPAKYASLAARALAQSARRPDVVWAHYLVPTGSIARLVARTRRVPFVVTAHGTDVANAESSPRLRRETQAVVQDAAAVVVVSADLGARLDALCGPLGDRLHVISAGVDTGLFHDGDRDVAAAAVGWDPPSPRLVYLGNLVEVKNLARLIEAFAILYGRGRAGGLAFAGDGPLRMALGEHARAFGVSGAVHFAGEVPRDEAPRWLRAADVVCLPSLREGLGLAALEGLACGRAVVVSRTAGAAAAVTDAVGALCDPRDVDSIAEAIAAAAALVPGRAAVAAAAPYALEREGARIEALLQAVAADASPKLRS